SHGAAAVRRRPGGLEHVRRLLSGDAPRRVRLRARDRDVARRAAAGGPACRAAPRRARRPPARDPTGMDTARRPEPSRLAASAADDVHRSPVLRRLRDEPDPAALVRGYDAPRGTGPLLPLLVEQSREPPRVARVPAR